MSILLFLNLKGGVAKTTNAVAVAECLADAGHKVLMIDADHQCMAGELLLGEDRLLRCEQQKRTLHDLLKAMLDDEFGAEQIGSHIVENVSDIGGGLETLSVLPCSIRIDDFQSNVAKAKHGFKSNDEFQKVFGRRKNMVRRWLKNNYDYTIIDCPPTIATQVRALLPVADSFIVPSIPDRLSVRGSAWLIERIRRLGVRKEGLGMLWSLYREQNQMHKRIVRSAGNGQYEELPRPFDTIIPNAAPIASATEPERTPGSFNGKYTPKFARLYRDLCEEIVERIGA